MTTLALLLIGFSIFSGAVLAITHFREANYPGQAGIRSVGRLLIFAVVGLQAAHWAWLYHDQPWTETAPYRGLLFLVAPLFWHFGRALLRGEDSVVLRVSSVAHVLPAIGALWLSPEVALPLAFVLGAGYLAALAHGLYRLRDQREQFTQEIVLLGVVFAIAVGVAGLGIFQAQLPGKLFHVLYSISIGLAFVLVHVALDLRPQLARDVTETAKSAYVHSTLTRVDRIAKAGELQALMEEKRAYENPDLDLATLAGQLALSAHQLSELINADMGKSFSRYVRERRVAAAKAMLCAEPSASVLSVGLSVGFTAQSNFYEAFREIEGMTPGQYRKLHGGSAERPLPAG